ncbi:ATP-binding protein [Pseudomonas defluvii]|uniref:ATP-binding protein n=1 Tax=Pseudomonas defluvii TaxID=1876757 RepID=UPI00390649D0
MTITTIEARYNSTGLIHYDGNPLIEALPPIIDDDSFLVSKIMARPDLPSTAELALPPKIRSHCVGRIKSAVMPLWIHVEFEAAFAELIRQGYTARHPFHRNTVAMRHAETDEQLRYSGFKSSADTLMLVGLSGMGKTTLLDAVVKLYPQVILHSSYQGSAFVNPQVVWLKIECPHDGSAKGLCAAFFSALDAALGTQYYQQFMTARATVSLLLQRMSNICRAYYIGALIIDELQHLNSAKEGDDQKRLLNFFVKLANESGVPIVLSGTNAMVKLFGRVVRNARRAIGMGQYDFDRFAYDDDEWAALVDYLWAYNWSLPSTVLTEEIKATIYDLTQGNTDFLVKLLSITQRQAIYDEKPVSAEMLREVYSKRMIILHKAIEALRSGDPDQIEHFEDMMPMKYQIAQMMEYDRRRQANRRLDMKLYTSGTDGNYLDTAEPCVPPATTPLAEVPSTKRSDIASTIANSDDWEAAMKELGLTGQSKHF